MDPQAHQIQKEQTSGVTELCRTQIQISRMHIQTEAPPCPRSTTMHKYTSGNRASLLTNCSSFQDIPKHQEYYYFVHWISQCETNVSVILRIIYPMFVDF